MPRQSSPSDLRLPPYIVLLHFQGVDYLFLQVFMSQRSFKKLSTPAHPPVGLQVIAKACKGSDTGGYLMSSSSSTRTKSSSMRWGEICPNPSGTIGPICRLHPILAFLFLPFPITIIFEQRCISNIKYCRLRLFTDSAMRSRPR